MASRSLSHISVALAGNSASPVRPLISPTLSSHSAYNRRNFRIRARRRAPASLCLTKASVAAEGWALRFCPSGGLIECGLNIVDFRRFQFCINFLNMIFHKPLGQIFLDRHPKRRANFVQ